MWAFPRLGKGKHPDLQDQGTKARAVALAKAVWRGCWERAGQNVLPQLPCWLEGLEGRWEDQRAWRGGGRTRGLAE